MTAWGAGEPEELLPGGHMNRVVRVGATVRRVQGREVLGFIAGEPCIGADPQVLWSDTMLRAAGRMLRAFHDAQAGFEIADGDWSSQAHEPNGVAEVLCHGDFAPYNAICRDGLLAGMIDFDLVAPGSRAWDLAWTAVTWVPLFDPADHPRQRPDPPESARRLALLCAAYGFDDRQALVDVIRRRLAHGLAMWAERRAGNDPWALLTEPYQPIWRRAQSFCEGQADALRAPLPGTEEQDGGSE